MESKSSKILAKVISIVMLLFMCGLPIIAATVAMTKGHTETTNVEISVTAMTESTTETMGNPWKVTTQKRIAVTTISKINHIYDLWGFTQNPPVRLRVTGL